MAKQTKTPPAVLELIQQFVRMVEESDRGFALTVAAWIDDAVGELIRSWFVDDSTAADELLVGDSPLATFSARIKILYCLGIISGDVKRDLNLIRAIRNLFAHERGDITFETPAVKDRCRGFAILEEVRTINKASANHPRNLYMLVSMHLISYFLDLSSKESRPGSKPSESVTAYFERARSRQPLVQRIRALVQSKVASTRLETNPGEG